MIDNELATKQDLGKLSTAVLVGIVNQECSQEQCLELLEELGELAKTMGLIVLDAIPARQRENNPAFLIGSGKAREIAARANSLGADAIVFDDSLTPSQQRNWEKIADLPVIDRQEVILEIFAQHAKTSEAVLQVELAKANYSLPRLRRKWTHLNRQRGMAGGMGLRGEGEQQIELDSRLVRLRIAKLKQQLEEVRKHRNVQRLKRIRKPVPVAAIVGYTNAGKSSLLNAMTKAEVLVADKLFATLDPTVRKFTLPGGQNLLLADTVGFIRKLPHLLVEAFKSTLEEAALADHVIEVVDASSPNLDDRHDTTVKVLAEIGAKSRHSVMVLNKMDLITDPLQRRRLLERFPDAVPCSAVTGEGLEELARRLEQACNKTKRLVNLFIPHSHHQALAQIRLAGTVVSEDYDEDGAHLSVRVPLSARELVKPFIAD